MKAFILDGSETEADYTIPITKICSDMLACNGWEVEIFPVRQKTINPCLSCSACGYKTPGLCAQKDNGNEIVKATAQCHQWVIITPILFGGYSPLLKKALERTLPNIHPYLKIYKGECHHWLRYDRRPTMSFIGWQGNSDAANNAIFARLCKRNATNYQVPHRTTVINGSPDPGELSRLLTTFLAQTNEP